MPFVATEQLSSRRSGVNYVINFRLRTLARRRKTRRTAEVSEDRELLELQAGALEELERRERLEKILAGPDADVPGPLYWLQYCTKTFDREMAGQEGLGLSALPASALFPSTLLVDVELTSALYDRGAVLDAHLLGQRLADPGRAKGSRASPPVPPHAADCRRGRAPG